MLLKRISIFLWLYFNTITCHPVKNDPLEFIEHYFQEDIKQYLPCSIIYITENLNETRSYLNQGCSTVNNDYPCIQVLTFGLDLDYEFFNIGYVVSNESYLIRREVITGSGSDYFYPTLKNTKCNILITSGTSWQVAFHYALKPLVGFRLHLHISPTVTSYGNQDYPLLYPLLVFDTAFQKFSLICPHVNIWGTTITLKPFVALEEQCSTVVVFHKATFNILHVNVIKEPALLWLLHVSDMLKIRIRLIKLNPNINYTLSENIWYGMYLNFLPYLGLKPPELIVLHREYLFQRFKGYPIYYYFHDWHIIYEELSTVWQRNPIERLETTLTTSLLSLNQEECLMTLHPRATNATFNILSPLQGSAWLGGLIMLMVILMGLISLAPDEESLFDILLWYTIESLGNIREQEKHFQDNDHALVGRTFNFLWRVAIFFLICAYNVELRAKAINQEFEHVPESVYDLEFPSDKTLLTPFGGSVALQGNNIRFLALLFTLGNPETVESVAKYEPARRHWYLLHERNFPAAVVLKREYYYMTSIWLIESRKGITAWKDFIWKLHEQPKVTYMPRTLWFERHLYWVPYVEQAFVKLSASGIPTLFSYSGSLYKGDVNPFANDEALLNELRLNMSRLYNCFLLLITGLVLSLSSFALELLFSNLSAMKIMNIQYTRQQSKFLYQLSLTGITIALVVALNNTLYVESLNDQNYVTFGVASPTPFTDIAHFRVFALKENSNYFYRCFRTSAPFLFNSKAKPGTDVKALAIYSNRQFQFCYSLGMRSTFNIHVTYDSNQVECHGAGQTALTLPNGSVWITGGFPVRKYHMLTKKTKFLDKEFFHYSEGPEMPVARAFHCNTLIDSIHVFIFGGKTLNDANSSIAHIYNFQSRHWITVSEHSPCGQTNSFNTHTVCGTVKSKKEVVIPTMDYLSGNPCTAVFKWPSQTWHRMAFDQRKSPLGGAVATYNSNGRLVYLGGFDINDMPSDVIYEYEGVERGWRIWDKKAPMPIANASFVTVDIDFCRHSNDLKRMSTLDPEGELQPGSLTIFPPEQLMYW